LLYILDDIHSKIKVMTKKDQVSIFGSSNEIGHDYLKRVPKNEFFFEIMNSLTHFGKIIEDLVASDLDNAEEIYFRDNCLLTIFNIMILLFEKYSNDNEKFEKILSFFKIEKTQNETVYTKFYNYFTNILTKLNNFSLCDDVVKILDIILNKLEEKEEIHYKFSEICLDLIKRDFSVFLFYNK
jgi:hypothetical protein